NGKATFSSPSLTVGAHKVSVAYSGDGNFGSSNSTQVNFSVAQAATTTATVNGTPSTIVYSQTVTFTTRVTVNTPGAGTPTGTVSFLDNGAVFGTATLSGGTASFTETTQLAAGNHNITVSYAGDGNFNPNTNPTVLNYTVNLDGTTTTVASSANPSV